MNEEVAALARALDTTREKLMATPRTAPGFGEMRAIYRELTRALIDAGDKADAELREEIELVSKRIAEDWESSKNALGPWIDVLKPVVGAVGAVGGHGVKGVGDSQQASANRYFFTLQPVWISITVISLMVMKDKLSCFFQKRNILK